MVSPSSSHPFFPGIDLIPAFVHLFRLPVGIVAAAAGVATVYVHDAEGDRSQGIVTIPNQWGDAVAFSFAWGLLLLVLGSIPIACFFLPIPHPLLFVLFPSLTILSLGAALLPYQRQRSDRTYQTLIQWERFSMVCGVFTLLTMQFDY